MGNIRAGQQYTESEPRACLAGWLVPTQVALHDDHDFWPLCCLHITCSPLTMNDLVLLGVVAKNLQHGLAKGGVEVCRQGIPWPIMV